jgi:CheY-like chemotaxis protein
MKQLLIVEDEPIIAFKHEVMVQEMGYDVLDKVTSGEQAIAFVKKQEPDAMLMDINLEGEANGIETVDYINETLGLVIPAIFISANREMLKKEQASKNDIELLSKPVQRHELESSLEEIVEHVECS